MSSGPLTTLTGFLVALVLTGSAQASPLDGWRWPRYDNKPIRIHIVTDTTFDRTLVPYLKDAGRMWERSGVFRFDYPHAQDCDTATALNTICVTTTPDSASPCPGFGGCSWQADLLAMLPDGTRLLSYARVWLNLNFQPGDWNWVRHVFCHELGHDLGLGHPNDSLPAGSYQPSCMSNDFRFYAIGPSAEDLTFLRGLYAVRDTR